MLYRTCEVFVGIDERLLWWEGRRSMGDDVHVKERDNDPYCECMG
jgi:hypothetical protein